MARLLISDPTLRDGSHAVSHQLSADQIAAYCRAADKAGIPVVEVGHGNGLGTSTLLLGKSRCSDIQMLATARENLKSSRLGVHFIPGFGTIERDLAPAIDRGVDVVRVATHCTEADVSRRYIEYARKRDVAVYGVLMMSHMLDGSALLEQARLMQSCGAHGIVLMDSAGHALPADVTAKVGCLADALSIDIGFHAHNNLGMAIANSLAAVEAGATIIDGTARGFGAGAGNAQLEVLVAVLQRCGHDTGISLNGVLDVADYAEKELLQVIPSIKSASIVSGLAGVFSGFMLPVEKAAADFGIDARELLFELGRRNILAGQEDYITEVAAELAARPKAATGR